MEKPMCSPYPKVSCPARVLSIQDIAPNVYSLVLDRCITDKNGDRGSSVIPDPCPGQFFMLRARPSGVFLGRPISVYRYNDDTITFLILKKGRGTAELCNVSVGQYVDVIGPIGNTFPLPDSSEVQDFFSTDTVKAEKKGNELSIAVLGGGIGVAPVAGFSLSLPSGSFDFYASFRSGSYGLDEIESRARKLLITTEDGSVGVKGMLPEVFSPDTYDLIYACGPLPMLKYVQRVCEQSPRNPLVFISLEKHMACGAGACLGCTIQTKHGNKRCCVDGPVFNAAEVVL